MAYTLDPTSGGNTTISTSALADNTTSQRYEGGIAIDLSVNISGNQLNTSRITADGTSASGDLLLATSGNDAIIWDDATTTGNQFGSQTRGFDWTSQTQAADIFQLYGGDDFVNLTSPTADYAYIATVYGGDGNDVIWSGDGADSLYGEAGDDFLTGDDGDDFLDGGDGDNTYYGGGGNDSIIAGNDDNTSYGGVGNDTIDDGGVGFNLSYGGDGNDTFYSADTAYGGAGNDNIDGGDLAGIDGSDTLYGDAGTDTLTGNAGHDVLSGGSDTDQLYGGIENDTLLFSRDNTVPGGGATNYVNVWDGEGAGAMQALYSVAAWSSDLMDGGGDTDTVALTDSNDILVLNTNDVVAAGAAQANNPNRLAGIELVLAGAGADIVAMNDDGGSAWGSAISIFGQTGDDIVAGGSGNDLVVGGSQLASDDVKDSDVLLGGAGNDLIWGDDLNDPDGSAGGADTLYGGSGSDTIYGGGGNDLIYGGSGASDADTVFGGAGDDTIFASDTTNVYGGDGKDIVSASFTQSAANFNFSAGLDGASDGADRVIVTGSYNLMSGGLGASNDVYISNAIGAGALSDIVDGQSGDDVISSWAGADTITGGAGTDVLWGGAGQDVLFGGADTDFLYAQEGTDTIYGGTGWDMVYFGRNDGGDVYFDENDVTGPAARENWLVVYGAFDQSETGAGADFLLDGAGIRETDHSLAEAIGGANMAQIANSGTNFTLTVANTSGGTSSLTFDSRDVAGIGLWDNDALDGHVIQVYLWNGSSYAYSYSV